MLMQKAILVVLATLFIGASFGTHDQCILEIINNPIYKFDDSCSMELTGVKQGICKNNGSLCESFDKGEPFNEVIVRMCKPYTTEVVTGTAESGCAEGQTYRFRNITSCRCRKFETLTY